MSNRETQMLATPHLARLARLQLSLSDTDPVASRTIRDAVQSLTVILNMQDTGGKPPCGGCSGTGMQSGIGGRKTRCPHCDGSGGLI